MMYLLQNLLVEMLKVVASLGVAGFLAAPRGRKKREQNRYELRDILVELLKVVVGVGVGAFLGAWRERKRNEHVRQELIQLRQSIGQDVQQALAQWSAQGQRPADRDERPADRDERPADRSELTADRDQLPFEPLVVSSRDEA